MNSTAIFSEILIVGIFGAIWILPLMNKYIGINHDFLQGKGVIPGLALFAFVYSIGILVNFISDIVFKKVDERVCSKHGGKKNIHVLRSWILIKSSDASNYMNQRRSFVRIHRSNAINFFLIAVTYFFLRKYISSIYDFRLVPIYLISCFLCILSIFAYFRTLNGYFAFITETKEVIDEINDNK